MARTMYATTQWHRVRAAVLRRDNYVCHWCGDKATEGDHLRSPREGGARYDPANVVASCKPCNASRGGHLARARELGVFLGANRALHPHLAMRETLGERVRLGAIRV
jgi:5-methylcytosine-specific restriction endonuclease McrA